MQNLIELHVDLTIAAMGLDPQTADSVRRALSVDSERVVKDLVKSRDFTPEMINRNSNLAQTIAELMLFPSQPAARRPEDKDAEEAARIDRQEKAENAARLAARRAEEEKGAAEVARFIAEGQRIDQANRDAAEAARIDRQEKAENAARLAARRAEEAKGAAEVERLLAEQRVAADALSVVQAANDDVLVARLIALESDAFFAAQLHAQDEADRLAREAARAPVHFAPPQEELKVSDEQQQIDTKLREILMSPAVAGEKDAQGNFILTDAHKFTSTLIRNGIQFLLPLDKYSSPVMTPAQVQAEVMAFKAACGNANVQMASNIGLTFAWLAAQPAVDAAETKANVHEFLSRTWTLAKSMGPLAQTCQTAIMQVLNDNIADQGKCIQGLVARLYPVYAKMISIRQGLDSETGVRRRRVA